MTHFLRFCRSNSFHRFFNRIVMKGLRLLSFNLFRIDIFRDIIKHTKSTKTLPNEAPKVAQTVQTVLQRTPSNFHTSLSNKSGQSDKNYFMSGQTDKMTEQTDKTGGHTRR